MSGSEYTCVAWTVAEIRDLRRYRLQLGLSLREICQLLDRTMDSVTSVCKRNGIRPPPKHRIYEPGVLASAKQELAQEVALAKAEAKALQGRVYRYRGPL